MKCPSCKWEQPENRIDCEFCGLVFAKWEQRRSQPDKPAPSEPIPAVLTLRTGVFSWFFFFQYWIITGMFLFIIYLSHFLPAKGLDIDTMLFWMYVRLGLILFFFFYAIALAIPRTIAVLDSEGIRFANAWWFMLFMRKWTKATWKDVAAVEAVGRRETKGTLYCRSVRVTIVTPDFKKSENFYMSYTHHEFFRFLDFLISKVDSSRFDNDLKQIMQKKNSVSLQGLLYNGRRWGVIGGLVFFALVIGTRFAGMDLQNRLLIIFIGTVILAVLGRFLIFKKN